MVDVHRIVSGNVNCYIVTQNAAYLAHALQIPIAMSEKDMDMIPDNRKQHMAAETFLGKIVLSVSLNSFEKDSLDIFEPTIYLKNGDNLFWSWKAQTKSKMGEMSFTKIKIGIDRTE